MAFVPTGMNCGVSTTPCGSSSRPRRARVDPSAGGGTRTSKLAAPGTVSGPAGRPTAPAVSGSARRGAGISKPRRREMRAGRLGGDAALRRAVEEAEPQQERLVDVLDGLRLLGQDGAPSAWTPDRAGLELLDDRGQELAIRGVEAQVVDVEDRHRLGDGLLVDAAVAVDLRVIPDPPQEPVHDPRRPPAALARSGARRPRRPRRRGSRPSGARSRSGRPRRRSRGGTSCRTGRAAGR